MRVVRMLFIAILVGMGGGLGKLGGGLRKVEKPEPDNPVVCIADDATERE